MANAHFAKGKQAILSAEINYLTATFKAVLVRNDYPQNLAVDEFLSDISAYVLGTAVALTGVSITDGIFDANDAVFPLVPAGDTAEGVVIYLDTGNPATSRLLHYIDQITSFPVATTGGNITVQWDNGAYKIFSL
jgi:hypothetical protein